jgi:hypothetical protein
VHDNATDPDCIGRMHDAPCGVADRCAAEAATRISAINGERREHHNRGSARAYCAAGASRRCDNSYRAARQGIIADDLVRLAHDERSRRATCLASARRLSQSSRETTPEVKSLIWWLVL